MVWKTQFPEKVVKVNTWHIRWGFYFITIALVSQSHFPSFDFQSFSQIRWIHTFHHMFIIWKSTAAFHWGHVWFIHIGWLTLAVHHEAVAHPYWTRVSGAREISPLWKCRSCFLLIEVYRLVQQITDQQLKYLCWFQRKIVIYIYIYIYIYTLI